MHFYHQICVDFNSAYLYLVLSASLDSLSTLCLIGNRGLSFILIVVGLARFLLLAPKALHLVQFDIESRGSKEGHGSL